MNFKELEICVIQWAEKKSLLAKDNSYQQYDYTSKAKRIKTRGVFGIRLQRD